MFTRLALAELEKWKAQSGRKPLIIRGARQVGKTTLVNQFASQFDQYIQLNLELPEDRKPFESFSNVDTLIQSLFFLKNQSVQLKQQTMLFIDEIQEVPEALNILRYIYEQEPGIAVIAAGSMLESLFNKDIHFPVGRVSFLMLRPVSFPEFLAALGEDTALEQVLHLPVNDFAHDKLLKLFHTYALIGGMPEVVEQYAVHRDLTALAPIFDALITSYFDDVEKYASNDSQLLHIRHVIRTSFTSAGKRIQFAGFGNSAYRSREMSEALRIAEKALLLYLMYPITSATLPSIPDLKKSPRLQILDTGMLNYFVGLQKDILGTSDLSSIYRGTLIEHLTGQEMLAFQYDALSSLSFWVREKKNSSAEVDYIYPFYGKLIPVETKSGAEGRLRSLHLYMDLAPHNMAIRFYAGQMQLTEATTPSGKKYKLLNLPYYLVSQLDKYLVWFQSEVPT
ncbi:MAG: AAA family ATPase [Saprospiraceae bacterium]